MIVSCKSDSTVANQISISGTSFSPKSLSVTVGTTVTWTNKEAITHTVTSDTGLFDSGDITNGQTYKYTFTTAGTYAYHCTHHAGMTGTIIVSVASISPGY